MAVRLFGGTRTTLADGWQDQSLTTILGGAVVEAREPAPGATLRLFSVIGGVDVIVPAGSRVEVSGSTLLGGRDIDVRPGDGPAVRISATTVLGGLRVREAR